MALNRLMEIRRVFGVDEHLDEFDGVDPCRKLALHQRFESDLADFLGIQMPSPHRLTGAAQGHAQIVMAAIDGAEQ